MPKSNRPAWVRAKFGRPPRRDPRASAEGLAVFAVARRLKLEDEKRFCVDPRRLAEIENELSALGLKDADSV